MLSNLAKSNRLPQWVLLSGRYTQNPFDRTGAAPLPAEQFLENCAFRYRETTGFDCHRVEGTSLRAGVAPAEAEHLFMAHCYGNSPSACD